MTFASINFNYHHETDNGEVEISIKALVPTKMSDPAEYEFGAVVSPQIDYSHEDVHIEDSSHGLTPEMENAIKQFAWNKYHHGV